MDEPEKSDEPPGTRSASGAGWSLVRQWREDKGWLLVPAFFFAMGVLIVVIQSTALPSSISAAQGHGLPGTATATDVDCGGSGGVCIYSGDYKSADGTVSFHNVSLNGGHWPIGKPVAALYQGQSHLGLPEIFQTSNHRTWLWEALQMAFGCSLMLLALVLYVLRVRGVITD